MKILHTSDWHLGKSLYDFSLLDDQRTALDFMLKLIEKESINAVIIAGDIYDRPVPSAEAVRLYDYFLTRAVSEIGVQIIAIAGNHDSASRLDFGSRLYSNSGYHIFGSVKAGQAPVCLRDAYGEIRFYAIPWLHPAEIRAIFPDAQIKSFDDAYRAVLSDIIGSLDSEIRNIAVAHGFFAGFTASNSERELLVSDSEVNIGGMDIADSKSFLPFDYAAFGHLHTPQRAGGENLRYSGSLLKYSLSEEKQKKSCVIIDIKAKNEMDINYVEIPSVRDVRQVTGSFDELMEPGFHKNKSFGDYVFANITDSGIMYPMEKLRTLFPNLLGLKFTEDNKDFHISGHNSAASAKPSVLEMFRRFYRDAKSAEMPPDRLDFLRKIIEESEAGI